MAAAVTVIVIMVVRALAPTMRPSSTPRLPMTDYQDTGSRRKPTAYTETGAAERVCPDCSAPEGHPCRWIAMDGQGDLALIHR